MVVPVPLPRHNLPPNDPEELGDKLAEELILESEKNESEASTKTCSSDSGIEDGKSTPTSEEKVLFEVIHFLFVALKGFIKYQFTVTSLYFNTPG